jgi:hypothetical protein
LVELSFAFSHGKQECFMQPKTKEKVEWVPVADGNADAMFVFDVRHAISDPFHDMSRKFIEKIPTLAVQCMKCGKVHPFADILSGCPRCSRTDYAYGGGPSQLTIVCTYCGAGILQSVKCACGGGNPINGRTLRRPKTGGCFIATAVYGSPIAPEVVVFRRFRDQVLLTSQRGMVLVDFYYAVSPPMALLISKIGFLRAIVRTVLLEPVLRLIKTAI